MALATIQQRYSLEQRIQRSQLLRAQWSFAAEVLTTYELILQFQQSLALALRNSNFNNRSHGRLPLEIDLSPVLRNFQSLLQMTTDSVPETIAVNARDAEDANSVWEGLLRAYWSGTLTPNDETQSFLLHVFLQPIAEHFSANADAPTLDQRLRVCPFCGRRPVCGILRPEGDGAKRSLLCSFCSTEWDYRRLVCPACEQEDVQKLPVYTAQEFPYIRIEACDVCQSFIKTIDLTKDGRAIPIVDEIASLPLTIWAQEKGYHKLQTNLVLM
ncbi:MAG TPA: formate dehydrogenase accessory protein FdhE [Terriglobales bacterium]|nr:formate dehydrogenase accessory protein FdhE [Terriglobales bacterium]